MEAELELLIIIKKQIEEYLYTQDPNRENPIIDPAKKLLGEIKLRLSHFCSHTIVEDMIDVDVDKSKVIHYCSKCETTV
jgi:hypothetical protein